MQLHFLFSYIPPALCYKIELGFMQISSKRSHLICKYVKSDVTTTVDVNHKLCNQKTLCPPKKIHETFRNIMY